MELGHGGDKIKRPWIFALILALSMVICVLPSSADNQSTSGNSVKIGSEGNSNFLKVNADYVVTVKTKVKVYYKVKKKVRVKVRYKRNGKWKTKYKKKYVYVYNYYYKYVYRTQTIRDVPPGECMHSTANCQITSGIVSKMNSITVLENETIPNPNPPEEPTPVEKPEEVPEPGPEPQINDSIFEENETAFLEAWNTWNQTNTTYTNFLAANQTYTQYLQDYEYYINHLNITVQKRNTYDDAVRIFEYVQHSLDYSYYYNTKRGASQTLIDGVGNCCDHTHLLVALARAAGIPARYAHGECTFSSGFRTGHVWAQLYVNGRWYDADAISFSNTFGTIANWNKATMTWKGIYSSLPF